MYKYIIALLIPIAAFGGGYYYGSGQVVEKVTVIKGETKTVVQEKIVTRTIIRRPDGTTEETVTEEVRDKQVKEKQNESVVEESTSGSNGREKYRIGASYGFSSLADAVGPRDWSSNVGLSASRRIAGPFWLDVGARPIGDRKEVSVGLAVTW